VKESPLAPHSATPAELKERHEMARAGAPYLCLRDGKGRQLLVSLDQRSPRLTIGRRETNDVALAWDDRVSRVHAELENVGGDWILSDDGLSSNGTWVGERRVVGRCRLRDGDVIRVGGTVLAYCAPSDGVVGTVRGTEGDAVVQVSPAQRRVLVALCRPALSGVAVPALPTNGQLAEELFLSVDSVKTHMKALFDAFGLEAVPKAEKRAALAQRAIGLGIVSERDLS
jgi:hypothetical protein